MLLFLVLIDGDWFLQDNISRLVVPTQHCSMQFRAWTAA
jgi:hypothetical protein